MALLAKMCWARFVGYTQSMGRLIANTPGKKLVLPPVEGAVDISAAREPPKPSLRVCRLELAVRIMFAFRTLTEAQWLQGPSKSSTRPNVSDINGVIQRSTHSDAFIDVVEQVREVKRLPSMNGGRRVRLKTQAEKVARRLRRARASGGGASADAGMTENMKLKLLPSRLLSVDEVVEEFEGKERSMLLDIVRCLRQSDLTTMPDSTPTSPRDHDDQASTMAERLLQLDIETLKRIAGKTQQHGQGAQTPHPTAPGTNGEDCKGAKPVADGKDGGGPGAARGGCSDGSGAASAPQPSVGPAPPQPADGNTFSGGGGGGGGGGEEEASEVGATAAAPAAPSRASTGVEAGGGLVTGGEARLAASRTARACAPIYTARSSGLVQHGLTSLRC
jgi:hypothetical protein